MNLNKNNPNYREKTNETTNVQNEEDINRMQ